MSGLGELDRPGPPTGAEAWDERSQEWLPETADEQESAAPDVPQAPPAPEAEPTTGRASPPTPRRTAAADPVKALMHRHRDLCERAVDPLEIAAGLEAHGVTDRTAARFRHRDVFSLAEEMYARVSRDGDTPTPPAPPEAPGPRADWALPALLPGTFCTATLVGLHLTHGRARLAVAAVGTLAVALALRAALARGPLGTRRRPSTHRPGSSTWTYWLLAYALLGDGLLRAALAGGPDGLPDGTPDGPWPLVTTPALALTWACVPAAWSARLLAVRARRTLTGSRGLEDFAASVRPLLLGTFTLFLAALAGLLAVSGPALNEPPPYAQTLTLGALLLLARLLTVHGFTHAPLVILRATATAQATALATVFAARLPGCDTLATPVRALTTLGGPTTIQTLTCGTGALILLIHATRTLTRASAHGGAPLGGAV